MKEKNNREIEIDKLTELMHVLHELKHAGKLPKELWDFDGFIEYWNPNKIE